MSTKAPKIDPSAWASQRDAKIQRANELRELRKRENEQRTNNNNQQQTPQPTTPPRNNEPPSDNWGGDRGGNSLGGPHGGGRYNKATRGGFTFAQTPSLNPPSNATGDENEVRQQLWQMKEAAQQHRRSVGGTRYPEQGGNGSPGSQPMGNYSQPDWTNHQNLPPQQHQVHNSAAWSEPHTGHYENGTRPPWLQNTPPRSNGAYNIQDNAVHSNIPPPSKGFSDGQPFYQQPSNNQYHHPHPHNAPPQQEPPHHQQGHPYQNHQNPSNYPPAANSPGHRSPRVIGGSSSSPYAVSSSPLRRPLSPRIQGNNSSMSSPHRNADFTEPNYGLKVRTPRERHDSPLRNQHSKRGDQAPYSPINGADPTLMNSDDVAERKHQEQLMQLQKQQEELQEQQRLNLERQKLLQEQQEEHQRKVNLKQQQQIQQQKLREQEEKKALEQQQLQQQQQEQQANRQKATHKAKTLARSCLFSFTAEHKSELTVECGDALQVLGDTTNNGWVLVEKVNSKPKANGKKPKGYIPMSYLGDEVLPEPVKNDTNDSHHLINESSHHSSANHEKQQVKTVPFETVVGSASNVSMNQSPIAGNNTSLPGSVATLNAATILPVVTMAVEPSLNISSSPQRNVHHHQQASSPNSKENNTTPTKLEVLEENLEEVEVLLRPTHDPNRDVGSGWADDFADAANPLDLAPRPLPKVFRKKKEKAVKKAVSNPPLSAPTAEVNADGSVAIRPQPTSKKDAEKRRPKQEKNESPRPTTPKLASPRRISSSESKRKSYNENKHGDNDADVVKGDTSISPSPRSPRRSRRNKSSKPPPPPPPPEEPPPTSPAKWDWEDTPIVSKVSTQLRDENVSSPSLPHNITIPAKTKTANTASWLEQPYGNPNSARSAGGLVSPRISPRPNSSRDDPTLAPGTNPISAPGSAPGKIAPGSGRGRRASKEDKSQEKASKQDDATVPYDVANEYGMNAMLRELHQARQSRRKSEEEISNMHTMAVDEDSNDFDNGGWKDERNVGGGYGQQGTVAVPKKQGGRSRAQPNSPRLKSPPTMVDSNELIMDHGNHHQKIRGGGGPPVISKRPSPWRAQEPNPTPKSPRRPGSKEDVNNYKKLVLHDAKEINRRDFKGNQEGGLSMDHHHVGGNSFDNEEFDRKKNRRKKPAPTPASGAVPLNVKNARRNAGDGDDHFPEDGSVASSDKMKKGKTDGTRQNFDKRTSRMKNARHFKGAIEGYRHVKMKYFEKSGDQHHHHDYSDDEEERGGSTDGLVKVFVRKRPMFEYEAARGEFDVVSIVSQILQKQQANHEGGGYNGCKVLIHNCVMHPDMKRMYHKACWFPAHHAFGESASNPGVFTKCALPLVKAVSDGNGVGTLFMYGQTGSGKTHTMTGIEEGVAMSLSQLLHPDDPNHTMSDESFTVRLRFFELVGKRCVDLIANKAGEELKLMNDGNDAVRPAGAAEPIVENASHLLSLLKLGKKRRATAPTDVNGGSSRSHAVCQIEVTRNGRRKETGLLTLVDCAGSERKEDSMYHDKERQRESTEINASLYALKECVRARALAAKGKNVQIPFRSSSLTKVLMESFVRTDAHLAVIATVSPIPTDTEHSISTLRTVCAIAGYNDSDMIEEKQEVKPNLPKREERVPPIKWTSDQLFAWVRSVSNGKFASVANDLPKGTSGKVVMRWGAAQFSAICGGPKVGGALQRLLQEERARCEQLEQLKRQDRLG